jgi:hypothetical protein
MPLSVSAKKINTRTPDATQVEDFWGIEQYITSASGLNTLHQVSSPVMVGGNHLRIYYRGY